MLVQPACCPERDWSTPQHQQGHNTDLALNSHIVHPMFLKLEIFRPSVSQHIGVKSWPNSAFPISIDALKISSLTPPWDVQARAGLVTAPPSLPLATA